MSRQRNRRKNKGGEELFSVKNGRKVDAHLHGPILDNPEADAFINDRYASSIRERYSPKDAELIIAAHSKALEENKGKLADFEKMARGGPMSQPWNVRNKASHPRHPPGMIKSAIPGRTDKIPMSVPAGAYIIPADIPSALGQGNTVAGGQILDKMLKKGPYGSEATGKIKSARPVQFKKLPIAKADGGATEESDDIPIIAAGGEYVVYPESVTEKGGGDMKVGHRVLDKLVLKIRKKNIETLRNLKPPKK